MTQSSPLALVTGTSSGIGEAVACELLRNDWRVVGVARRPSTLDDSAYTHVQMDLRDVSGLAERIDVSVGPMIEEASARRLALVNNAADPGLIGTVARLEPGALLDVLALNVAAAVGLMGWMLRRSPIATPLRIVNVSSGAGLDPYPGLAAYGGSKAALRMAGMVMAAELDMDTSANGHSRDVTLLSYSPGPVDTEMQEQARGASLETFPLRDTFRSWSKEGRLVSPDVPAGEIRAYVESDGHPRFLEAQGGDASGS